MKLDMQTFDYMKTILNLLYLLSFLLLMGCNRECYEPGMEKYLPTAETGDIEASSSSVTFNGSISGLKVGQSAGLYESDIHNGPNKISATYFLLSTDKHFRNGVEQVKADFSSASVDSETDYYKWIHCDYRAYGRELQPNTTYYYKFCAEQGSDDELYAEIHGDVKSFTTSRRNVRFDITTEYYVEKNSVMLLGCISGFGEPRTLEGDDVAVVISQWDAIDDDSLWFWASEYYDNYSFESYSDGYQFSFNLSIDPIKEKFPDGFCCSVIYKDILTGEQFDSGPYGMIYWQEE